MRAEERTASGRGTMPTAGPAAATSCIGRPTTRSAGSTGGPIRSRSTPIPSKARRAETDRVRAGAAGRGAARFVDRAAGARLRVRAAHRRRCGTIGCRGSRSASAIGCGCRGCVRRPVRHRALRVQRRPGDRPSVAGPRCAGRPAGGQRVPGCDGGGPVRAGAGPRQHPQRALRGARRRRLRPGARRFRRLRDFAPDRARARGRRTVRAADQRGAGGRVGGQRLPRADRGPFRPMRRWTTGRFVGGQVRLSGTGDFRWHATADVLGGEGTTTGRVYGEVRAERREAPGSDRPGEGRYRDRAHAAADGVPAGRHRDREGHRVRRAARTGVLGGAARRHPAPGPASAGGCSWTPARREARAPFSRAAYWRGRAWAFRYSADCCASISAGRSRPTRQRSGSTS